MVETTKTNETETEDVLKHLFTYHKPTEENIPKFEEIREAGLAFAKVIDKNCPGSPDRTTAVRKIREAVMYANASLATGGGYYR